uniref:Major facilitator superfamily (MFS) profile domain-containing protein n=1 Tax=Quercus lobata TaxID=97700 RepID=A0A7N2LZE4_QUELO
MKTETLTLVLVNLAGIMERADESLLPGVYKEVGEALHTDPTGLGSLTLFRSIVQSSCYPLAAYLAVRHNRAHVIALGAFLWAAATFLVAISSTFFQVAVSRGLNGIGLAIVTPAIQSLVADSTDDSNRGMAFGWLQLTGNLGSIIGGLSSVLIASTSFMGIPGWRIAFVLVGLVSVIVGTLVYLFANDPNFSETDRAKGGIHRKPFWLEVKDVIKEAKSVMRIPSFQIIVAQGVSGSFPWSALSFTTMWLELIGFSHKTTALLWTLFIIAASLGGLFGGKMGDSLAKRLPNSGRILLSQISSGSAIPLAAILLLVLPDDPSTGFMHGLVLFVMGLSISWNAPATNKWMVGTIELRMDEVAWLDLLVQVAAVVQPQHYSPIFAEIVPEKSRTSIYALDRSFESILSSFAPPVVGILAQHVYSYKPVPKGSSDAVEIETDRENAASLAKALYTAIGLPMAICCSIYSFLYCTYPRDRERARMQELIESEMQQLEDDNSPSREEFAEVHVSETKESNDKERSEVSIKFGEEENLDLDDNDEKSLLSHQQMFLNPGQ